MILRITLVVTFLLISASDIHAIDFGDPVYASDVRGKVGVEVLYGKYDRDVKFDFSHFSLVGPGGTESIDIADQSDSLEGNVYMIRTTFFASETVSLYASAGILDDSYISSAYILGSGVRVLAYKSENFRVSIYGSIHYIPSVDFEERGYNSDVGSYREKSSSKLYESSMCIIMSRNMPIGEGATFIPYSGLALSILRGTTDGTIDFLDYDDVHASYAYDFSEDSPLHIIAGGTLLFNDKWSIRIEGRFVGAMSVTGGIGIIF